MSLDPQRFCDHIRAAYGAEGWAVVKGDSYYGGTIATLPWDARNKLIRELADCGYVAEFGTGALGGEALRLRCINPVEAKRFIESMNAVEERRDAELAKKGHKR